MPQEMVVAGWWGHSFSLHGLLCRPAECPQGMEVGFPQGNHQRRGDGNHMAINALVLEVTSHHLHHILAVGEVGSICLGLRGKNMDPTPP